jgi:ferric-dicitrate binding protein FerR (iron transport regulator)
MKNELTILIEKFLRKQISEGEVSRLKKLLMQVEAEDMLSSLYDEKWEQAASVPEQEMEDRMWSKLRERIQPEPAIVSPEPVKRFLWKQYLRIAASILIPLLCIGLGYFYSENKPGQGNDKMTVQVETGQKAKMQLPDGTDVWLNSASSLTYDGTYNKTERVVYLQGEAYFEVSKDKARPFIVRVNDISIEALGTSFNVKAYPDDGYIAATLIEGSIRVYSPFQSEILEPNEKLTFSKENGLFARSVLPDAGKNALWIDNQLAFEQERLGDIAGTLERMYNVRVHFASEDLKNIRFSGTVKNNNLENVLQLIAFVSPIRYSLENDTTIVIHSK